MKLSVLDVMGDALSLVRKSDLAGATAVIRKALSGETDPGANSSDPDAQPYRPSAKVIPLPGRRQARPSCRRTGMGSTFFRDSASASATAACARRCSRRILANVLRRSVSTLGV